MSGGDAAQLRRLLFAAAATDSTPYLGCLPDAGSEAELCAAVELLDAPEDPAARRRWRRATGRFYTPPATARRLADSLLAHVTTPPENVIDPACGAGELLVAMFDAIAARWPELDRAAIARRLHGIDSDPAAAALANARLQLRGGDGAPRVYTGDALAPAEELPWAAGGFDMVIANPPFGNAIERETARSHAQHVAWAARFPLAARGAYDRASLFVERALHLVTPGGSLGLLLPRAWLVAPSSDAIRGTLRERLGPPSVVLLTPGEFPAVATSLALVTWTHRAAEPEAPHDSRPRLGDLADIRAGMTTAEAYLVRDLVQEGGEGFGLVTAGSIDPDVVHWGRTQRYLGRRLDRPTLHPRDIPGPRLADCHRERVLVAGLSRQLEAVVAPAGRWVAAVSVIQVVPRPGGPDASALAAMLNHPMTRAEYARRWADAALGGGSIPVTAGRLRELRIGREHWQG